MMRRTYIVKRKLYKKKEVSGRNDWIMVEAGEEEVEVAVDFKLDAIGRGLAQRAANNRNQRARILNGQVVAKVVAQKKEV